MFYTFKISIKRKFADSFRRKRSYDEKVKKDKKSIYDF